MSVDECVSSSSRDGSVSNDESYYISVLSDLTDAVNSAAAHVRHVKDFIQREDGCTAEDGISLLELKNDLMLNYIINLVQLMLVKVKGQSIDGSPYIDELIEGRVILEKIQPLEKKLKYQIDKLLKAASTDLSVKMDDPLQYKPHPQSLIPKVMEDDDGNVNEGRGEITKYIPPKVRPMPFDDEGVNNRTNNKVKRKQSINESLMEELREEFSDIPLEVKDTGRYRMKHKDKDKEIQNYEEEYFIRTRGKKKPKKEGMSQTINDILDFGTSKGSTNAGRKSSKINRKLKQKLQMKVKRKRK